MSLLLPRVLQTDPTGNPNPNPKLNPQPLSRRHTTLPTRVCAISDVPSSWGGIDIWSNLVFIHYWVLPKNVSILSIDTWGENPFFHPRLDQANFPEGAFSAHGPALSKPISREGGGGRGGGRRQGPRPGAPPPPCNKHHHRTQPALKGLLVNQKKWPRGCARLDAGVAHGCARLAVKMAHGCAR